MFTLAGKHQVLDSVTSIWASLHSAYPTDSGLNELAGSGYSRQALTLGSAVNGRREVASNPIISIPTGSQAQWLGYWASQTAGVFLGFVPIGGKDYPYLLCDDLFTIYAPGLTLALNDRIVFAGFAPGLTMGVPNYYAVNVNGSFFRAASIPNGAALPLGYPTGRGTVGRIRPLSFPNGGSITVNESTWDMGVHATNAPPVFSGSSSFNVTQGSTFDLDASFSDPEGNPITYSVAPETPTGGLVTVASNGVVTGVAAGTVSFDVLADDGQG